MTSNPRAELREIVGEVRAYLEAQRELGVEQVDVLFFVDFETFLRLKRAC